MKLYFHMGIDCNFTLWWSAGTVDGVFSDDIGEENGMILVKISNYYVK